MNIMVSINVSIMVIIKVSKILTKNSFKSGNGLVISPLLQDFSSLYIRKKFKMSIKNLAKAEI